MTTEHQSFYRKYRSTTFATVVGQDTITTTLRNAVRQGRVFHAYLFCGPRGTGKTSTGRILAKALNCLEPTPDGEPCAHCAHCQAIALGNFVDLIEIDAASNRKVEDVENLRDLVRFAPSLGSHKVYIIDEVHMLSKHAFNALLKTLEEPPPRTVFVLATTDPQDVPATILSRCQRFDFRRIPLAAAVGRLRHVAEAEQIAISDHSLALIARQSAGSLRDAENLLDQLRSFFGSDIADGQVREFLGSSDDVRVAELTEWLIDGQVGPALTAVAAAADGGVNLKRFARDLVDRLRAVLLLKLGGADTLELDGPMRERLAALSQRATAARLLALLNALSEAESRLDGFSSLPLELAIVEALMRPDASSAPAEEPPMRLAPERPARPAPPPPDTRAPSNVVPLTRRGESAAPAPTRGEPETAPPPPVRREPEPTPGGREPEPPLARPAARAPMPSSGPEIALAWTELVGAVRERHKQAAAVLESCQPLRWEAEEVEIGAPYPFHRDKLSEPRFKRTIEEALSRLRGGTYRVSCRLIQRDKQSRWQAAANDPLVRAATEQYGMKILDVD